MGSFKIQQRSQTLALVVSSFHLFVHLSIFYKLMMSLFPWNHARTHKHITHTKHRLTENKHWENLKHLCTYIFLALPSFFSNRLIDEDWLMNGIIWSIPGWWTRGIESPLQHLCHVQFHSTKLLFVGVTAFIDVGWNRQRILPPKKDYSFYIHFFHFTLRMFIYRLN